MNHYAADVFKGFGVTEEEVTEFANAHVGFCSLDLSYISQFFLIQLASISKYGTYNSFSVTDVIQELEGVGRGCSPKVGQFKHPPLKGFWKAHFFDARFIPRNLINYLGLEFENSPKFNALCTRVVAEEEKSSSKVGWQGRLVHEMTIGAFEERASKGGLTGEWIVFSKHNGQNYYLCISRHTNGEGDQHLYDFLYTLCQHEFPFLFSEKPA
jgi:hypothetical protein